MLRLEERVEDALRRFRGRWPVLRSSLNMRERRTPLMRELTEEDLREARRIKEENLERLEENLEKLRGVAQEKGAEIYLASSAEDARKKIVEICKMNDVKLVVKSKSLTTEEIELNKSLQSEGIEVVETDLGERIIQLLGQRPSHILGPALHLTRREVAEVFSKHLGKNIPPEPEEIVKAVREELRAKFMEADLAVTGANLVVAESGAIVLVTNEGNDRLCLAFSPIHIIVAGVEKIVSTVSDALKILRVLPKSAGQRLTIYTTFQSFGGEAYPRNGERKLRKTYLILIDNGRLTARADEELRESLYCLRCAACLSVCPTYNLVGGHVFGYIYSGPMGIPWTAIAHGLENTEFSQLCYTCGLCKDACPLDIDLPYINSVIKERWGKLHGHPRINKIMARYESFALLGSFLSPIVNPLLKSRSMRKILEAVIGIDRRRLLPEFKRKNLGRLFREGGSGEAGKIALFTDSLIYYSYPEIGLAIARLLMELGFHVVLPKQRSSGMPLIQYGFLDKAREIASYNIKSFLPLIEEGYKIISVEPTASYCLKEAYVKLLKTNDAETVARNSYDFFEYLLRLDWDKVSGSLQNLGGVHLLYHKPCHSQKYGDHLPVKEILERLGAQVSHLDLGCCGMAGTWGMKKNGHGYDVSIEIGKILVSEYEKSGADLIVTESTVCRLQFLQLSKLPVKHPIELIYPSGLFEVKRFGR